MRRQRPGLALCAVPRHEKSTTSFSGELRPGDERELHMFDCDSSVQFWRSWSWDDNVARSGSNEAAFAEVMRGLSPDMARDPVYWAYHLGRSLLFAGQGAASLAAFGAQQSLQRIMQQPPSLAALGRLLAPRNADEDSVTDASKPSAGPFDGLDRARKASGRLFSEAVLTYRQDLEHIRQGHCRLPWDMESVRRNRQWSPVFIASAHSKYMREAVATLTKRQRSSQQPSSSSTPDQGGGHAAEQADKTGNPGGVSTDVWLQSRRLEDGGIYPDYYLNTFHFQTDGWLSSESAAVYETSTETLFIGRQDAMQRHAIVPISKFLAADSGGPGGRKLLELGCGTGRFHTFLKDNFPTLQTTALDLSPYYLEEARRNEKRWRAARPQRAASSPPTSYLHHAAESVPMESESQDIVVAIYMLHEMPTEARQKLAEVGLLPRCPLPVPLTRNAVCGAVASHICLSSMCLAPHATSGNGAPAQARWPPGPRGFDSARR